METGQPRREIVS